MTNSFVVLTLDLRSYWIHAYGEGGGADFDLVMDRDDDGLPLLRGKHVAGLLRLALDRAHVWGWFDGDPLVADVSLLLMGGENEPGCLDVRSARIPSTLRRHLLEGDPELKPELEAACFRRVSTTAIDSISSTAKEKHLRTIEVAVPLPLEFTVSFDPSDRLSWAGRKQAEHDQIKIAEKCWINWLEIAWPALDEVGAKRTRGFGRLAWVEFSQNHGGQA